MHRYLSQVLSTIPAPYCLFFNLTLILYLILPIFSKVWPCFDPSKGLFYMNSHSYSNFPLTSSPSSHFQVSVISTLFVKHRFKCLALPHPVSNVMEADWGHTFPSGIWYSALLLHGLCALAVLVPRDVFRPSALGSPFRFYLGNWSIIYSHFSFIVTQQHQDPRKKSFKERWK